MELPSDIGSAIKEASDYLRSEGEFNPKIAADLLRTSLDTAHRRIVDTLQGLVDQTYKGGEKDGSRRAFMREVGFISPPEEKFFTAIYALLSEEATHKLIAPKESIRMLKVVVSGYLRLLFRRVESWPERAGSTGL